MRGWKDKTLAHWDMIDSMARSRFGDRAVAEEATLFVVDALEEDEWQRVRSYGGKASFTAFLRSVVYRLLEDYSRHKYGRRQPPQWIRRLGGLWLRLYILLCLERLSIVDAVERSWQMTGTPAKEKIEEAAFYIKEQITNCGSHQFLEVALDQSGSGMEDKRISPESRFDENQKNRLLRGISNQLTGVVEEPEEHLSKVFDLPFDLTSQEKLLLRMRYVDGMRVAMIAEMVGSSRHAVNGRLRRILQKVRAVLEARGVAQEVVDHLR